MKSTAFRIPFWLIIVGLTCACGLAGIFVLKRTEPGKAAVRWARNHILYRSPAEQIISESIAPSPIPRFEAQSIVSGGKLYVFGGFVSNLKVTARSDVYDPATDSWTRIADLPIPVTHAGFAVDGGTAWMAGGFVGDHPGTAVRDVWKYDIAKDEWTPGPPLPSERAAAGLVLLARDLHLIGGLEKDRQTDAADHWVLPLDGDLTWRADTPLPVPRNHAGVVAYEGRIFALGGQHGHDGPFLDLDVAHVYDPLTGRWHEIARLPRPRSHFEPGTFIADGRIVIVGGRSNAIGALYDITAYDPARDVWQDLPGLPVALRAPLAKPVSNQVIIGQGGLMPSGTAPSDEMIRCSLEAMGLKDGARGP